MAGKLAGFLASNQAPTAGFANNLLVYNRTKSVAEEFAQATPGCQAVGAVADLAPAAGMVFSCLSNDAATDAVSRLRANKTRRAHAARCQWPAPCTASRSPSSCPLTLLHLH